MTMDNEQEAREYLRQLKDYYTGLASKGGIFLICVFVWLFTGGAPWPLWVLLAFAIHAFIGGVQLGIFPMLPDLFPFLKKDWEEDQLRKILEEKKEASGSSKEKSKKSSE